MFWKPQGKGFKFTSPYFLNICDIIWLLWCSNHLVFTKNYLIRVWYADFDIISWNILAYEVIYSSVWGEKIFNVMFSHLLYSVNTNKRHGFVKHYTIINGF